MNREKPASDSPLAPTDNYFGIEFDNAFWEDVLACCIFPPDAAFRDTGQEWEDAEGNPIPRPEGEDGHRITILWRMDAPEDKQQQRPRLYAILAAFAHLYRRRVARKDWLRLVMVRYTDNPPSRSDVPAVNFRLWQHSFMFVGGAFTLAQVEGREYEPSLPAPLPPADEAVCKAAHEQWRAVVNTRIRHLLSLIHDAESYETLMPTLDEWRGYSWQLLGGYDAEWEAACKRLQFCPWYAEVLRRMPGLNEMGLCCIALPSIGRLALLDYRPEEGRRFRYEGETSNWPPAEGTLHPAEQGDTPLPYDAAKHLHLLPIPCDSPYGYARIGSIKVCIDYNENWLGRDYCWDKPTE